MPFCDLNAKRARHRSQRDPRVLQRGGEKKYKVHVRVFLSRYRGYARVPGLRRLAAAARSAVRARGRKTIADLVADEYRRGARSSSIRCSLSPEETAIAEKILVEIRQRLKFLNDVGLEYLTLDRLSATLRAAKRSAFSWRRVWVRDWWALLRARRAFDRAARARHGSADPDPGRTAGSGQHHRGRGARSGRDARRRTTSSIWAGRGRARRARAFSRARIEKLDARRQRVAHLEVSARRSARRRDVRSARASRIRSGC